MYLTTAPLCISILCNHNPSFFAAPTMEFRYRDGEPKDPTYLQPTSSQHNCSVRRQPRPNPTESGQSAQLQYSSSSYLNDSFLPMELPYQFRTERVPQSSTPFASQLLLGSSVDGIGRETGRTMMRRPVPALLSLQEDTVEEQLGDLVGRETECPLQVMRRPVSATVPLQRGLINREIERPLHVLNYPMPALEQMQRREMEKERIRRELREQIREEMLEKEQREYAEMRRILEEEVRQELEMERARGVGNAPLVLQPPHQPVPGNFQHEDSDFWVTFMDREMEMGETMGNPQVSMDEQLSLMIKPSPDVTTSTDFPTEPFQPQMKAGDEHDSTSQVNHIAASKNELADDNFKNDEHISEQRIIEEEVWIEEQLHFLRPFPASVQDKVEHHSILHDSPIAVVGEELTLIENDNDAETNDVVAQQQRIVDEELWTEEQLPFMRPFPANVQDKVEHRSLLQDNPITVDGNKLVLTERDNDVDTNNIKPKANLSNWKAPGIKRYGQDTVKSSSKKIRTGEESWACAVCHVTPPSEEHLNVHLQGKKHKTRVEKLTLEETSIIKSDASSASKPDNTPKPTLLQAQDGEKVTMKIDGKSHKVIIKTDSVWCDPCMVVCNSREMMVSHLKGKKHIQRMKKLNITEDGAN